MPPTLATDPIIIDRITAGPTMVVTQPRSRSRLVTGLTTFTAVVITQAARIMAGGRDIGRGTTTSEFGSTAITW